LLFLCRVFVFRTDFGPGIRRAGRLPPIGPGGVAEMRGSALPRQSTSVSIGIPKTGGRSAHTGLAQIAGSA
jgi:hypothetical protein